jgi:caa(3)-type oxidase subunit IV
MATTTTHAHPNYMRIFWILLVLTIVEVAVAYMGLPKLLLASLLIVLAVWKAALVALHFMHLKLEKKTLTWIALSPFILCVFLILMLMPDIFPR